MQKNHAELEVGIHRAQGDGYQVELRFTNPASDAETAPAKGACDLRPAALAELLLEPGAYGKALAEQLFADEGIRRMYGQVMAAANAGGHLLRLRLHVGASAPELHDLRWELLADPDSGDPLATSQRVLFSRYMTSEDWRTVKLRPRGELSALVAVSAPSNIEKYKLPRVPRDAEVARARACLQGVEVTVAGTGAEEPLTVDRLIKGLCGVDILYLVSHGAVKNGKAVIYLQRDDGEVQLVRAADLALRFKELPELPRLVVLASCDSAGGGADANRALAPLLADAGVPAIVAMQGKISMETVEQLMPSLFSELLRDGQIDRAMAAARGCVRGQPDAWMPALFLRLRSGRLWYEPGFAGDGRDFDKWRSICRRVHKGEFIHRRAGPRRGDPRQRPGPG